MCALSHIGPHATNHRTLNLSATVQFHPCRGGFGRAQAIADILEAAGQASTARDASRFTPFIERFAKFASVLARLYQLPAPDIDTRSPREQLPLAALALRVRRLGRADMTEFLRVMPMSVQDLVDDEFETEWLKALIASVAVRDLRQGPRSGATTFNLLHRMVGVARGSSRMGGWFEKGQELSAGQWQKLAVARAFMRDDAEVLILDEPTASIDAEAEHALFERFQALAADRIAIVISHRFSTVRMADQIVVLDGAKVVEIGTHEALIAKGGQYAELYGIQAAAYR